MEKTEFEKEARAHRSKLYMWFIALLTQTFISIHISSWSEQFYGWESELIYSVFKVISWITILGILIFGIMIYAWYSNYKTALRDSEQHTLESMREMHRDVLGPIRWK